MFPVMIPFPINLEKAAAELDEMVAGMPEPKHQECRQKIKQMAHEIFGQIAIFSSSLNGESLQLRVQPLIDQLVQSAKKYCEDYRSCLEGKTGQKERFSQIDDGLSKLSPKVIDSTLRHSNDIKALYESSLNSAQSKRLSFPTEDNLKTCLKKSPLLQATPYWEEKGTINKVASAFAGQSIPVNEIPVTLRKIDEVFMSVPSTISFSAALKKCSTTKQ